MSSDQTLLMGPSEVICELGISYSTLLRRVRNNEIPFVRIGKQLRFPRTYFEGLEKDALKSFVGDRND